MNMELATVLHASQKYFTILPRGRLTPQQSDLHTFDKDETVLWLVELNRGTCLKLGGIQ